MDDLAVAAFDQHVGHRFAQRLALRNREQVLLALAAGVGQEFALVEPLRLTEHEVRDFDVVVEGEHVDDVRGGVRNRRQPLRELGAGLCLDRFHESRHDVVKQADLILRVARRTADEEIGDAGQHFNAARVGAGGERSLEFVKQREGTHHGLGRRHAIELAVRMPWEG